MDNDSKKYCCICDKEIVIGDFCDADHQQYNFISHIMGEPMLCSDCWKKVMGGKE